MLPAGGMSSSITISVWLTVVFSCSLLGAGFGFADSRSRSQFRDIPMDLIVALNGAFLGAVVGALICGVVAGLLAIT